MHVIQLAVVGFGAALLGTFQAIPQQGSPKELGQVDWGRDLDTAKAESANPPDANRSLAMRSMPVPEAIASRQPLDPH